MVKEGLLKIKYSPPYHHWLNRASVSPSPMNSLLGEIFDAEGIYTLFRTVGNTEAVKLLEGYYGERKKSEPWVVHKRRNSAILHSGFGPGRRPLYLDNHLKEVYLNILEERIKKEFGANNYRDFPLVNGAFSMDAPPEAILWPHIHVIKGREATKRKYFQELIDSLTDVKTHAQLRKEEEPQNYRTGEIDILHKYDVNPLVLEDRVWVCKGTELKNIVDFLMPFTFDSGRSESCSHCDDD
ncbi:MAG: hypothetical protein AABX23_04935 [Nanoarchaeota archaeon]